MIIAWTRNGAIARERGMSLFYRAFEENGVRSNLFETAWNSSGLRWSTRAMTHARNFIAKGLSPPRANPRHHPPPDKCRWHAIDPRCLQNNALPPGASSKSVVARMRAHCFRTCAPWGYSLLPRSTFVCRPNVWVCISVRDIGIPFPGEQTLSQLLQSNFESILLFFWTNYRNCRVI